MLAEGIMLLLSVVDVFGTVTKRWYLALPLGWGEHMYIHVNASSRNGRFFTLHHSREKLLLMLCTLKH